MGVDPLGEGPSVENPGWLQIELREHGIESVLY
jgi:hypothetical protein